MRYFNFDNLIRKYTTTFTAEIQTEKEVNSKGDYVRGEPKKVELQGAIISHRQSTVFRSEGTVKSQDKALFMTEPLPDALQGAKVIHDGKVYSIGDELENGAFTGVWKYTLKYCSAFNKGASE